jgi:hypothetical protein
MEALFDACSKVLQASVSIELEVIGCIHIVDKRGNSRPASD